MQSNESIGGLVARLEAVTETSTLSVVFNLFSVLAVVSSFLTVGLSLTDYLIDRLNLSAGVRGRVLATFIAFAPPAMLSALFPYGFVAAIGLAGLLMVLGLFVVPVLMSHRNRERPGSFAVASIRTSNWVLVVVLLGSLFIAVCHVLEMQALLPSYLN
jgi:tryptophan-specific transport protein